MEELTVSSIKTCITDTLECLYPFLPIANAHANKFISDGHWETFLPTRIQQQLLLLSNDELRNLPCELPYKQKCADQNSTLTHDIVCAGETSEVNSCQLEWKHKDLEDFCKDASNCTLNKYNVSTQKDKLLRHLNKTSSTDVFVKEFMNLKKGHEVDVMSHVCAVLAKELNCQLVIDFGSGKGYLGQNLCLQYGVPVLGIDAAQTNTLSAEKRLNYLSKQWEGLSLNAKLSNDGQKLSKKAKKKLKSAQLDQSKPAHETSSNEITMAKEEIANLTKMVSKYEADDEASDRLSAIKTSNNYVSVTMFVDKNTDFMKIAREHFPYLDLDLSVRVGNNMECVSNINSVVRSDTNTEDNCNSTLTGSHIGRENICNLMLTGLHTCGDLASTTLHIFVNNPQIKAVCSVGCCYNLLTEQFMPNKELSGKDSKLECGFPMSQFLQEKKVYLGDSARNLACQSVQRMSAPDQPLQGERFFPRALLEVLVQNVCKQEAVTWKGLRNLEKKCSSTEEYLRRACEKLNMSDQVSQEVIQDHIKRYSDYKHKLAAFFQLRMVLAPCIESLILMDRLCYLLEQGNIGQVYLVQLFDPLISPRCYGIVAMKK